MKFRAIQNGRRRALPLVEFIQQMFSFFTRIGAIASVKYLLRFVCKPKCFFKWLRFVSDFDNNHGLGRPSDELLRKKTYRFFAFGLPRYRGHELLVDHFNLAESVLPRDILLAMWRGLSVNIGSVVGRRESYTLSMHLSDRSEVHHEGGFSIKLTRLRDQFDLVRLSFIFYKLDDIRCTIAIGGLQGSNRPGSKRAFIESTRDMHGLRPKDAIVFVIEGLAISVGADLLFAVSNAKHTINFHRRKKRLMKFADLDRYWTDRGGKADGEFGFIYPVKNHEVHFPLSRRDMCKREFVGIGKNLSMGGRHQAPK